MSTARSSIAYSQNFLRNPRLVDRLLDRSGLTPDDLVIEIGPGRGIITERLAVRCRQVLAVEKDPILVERLRPRLANAPNVALFAADFLHFPLPLSPYKVFANVPFAITAAIVGKLTSGTSPPVDAFLAVQREAAERFLGAPRETLAAILLKPWFEPEIVHRFRASDFVPAPGVEVVLLRVRRRETPLVREEDAVFFADFVTYAFTAWQPTVREALARFVPKSRVALIEAAVGSRLDCPPSATPLLTWLALTNEVRVVAGDRATVRGARARLERQQDGLQKMHRTRQRGMAQR